MECNYTPERNYRVKPDGKSRRGPLQEKLHAGTR